MGREDDDDAAPSPLTEDLTPPSAPVPPSDDPVTEPVAEEPADLWRQLTPVPPPPAIDAEYAVSRQDVVDPVEDDDAYTETVEAWQEADEFFSGDGPFAVPIDDPASAQPKPRAPADPMLGPERWSQPQGEPLILKRRTGGVSGRSPPKGTAEGPSSSGSRVHLPRTGGPRRYPRMLALLKDQTVAQRPAGRGAEVPPPVPGTFFPAPREPREPPPSDLDRMLLTMAEGLLIGETADGETEVRVTLKDEFFAGTELRIVAGDGKVKAVLAPPDRDVYWQLNGSLDDLKHRLSDRGLKVEDIELVYP